MANPAAAVADQIVRDHEQQRTYLQEKVARLSQTAQPNGTHSEETSAAINLLADRILAQTKKGV